MGIGMGRHLFVTILSLLLVAPPALADTSADNDEPESPSSQEAYDPHAHEPEFPANKTRFVGAQSFDGQITDRGLTTLREDTPRTLIARFGKFLNPYVALEGRLGFGTGIRSGDARIDQMGGLFANAYWPFNDRVAIYVLGGATYAEGSIRSQPTGQRRSWSEAGLSSGAGINLFTRGGLGVYAEYVWYFHEEATRNDVEMEGWGLGAQIAF